MEGVYDVVVVGGGIMGLCTAFQLARRGRSVILIEQFDVLHHRGSSHGQSRTLRLTYPEDYYTLMVKQALDLWHEAEIEAGCQVYRKTGQLDLGHKDHAGLLQLIAACKKHGLEYEILDKDQLAQKFSMIQLPEDYIAVHSKEAGILRATKACAMFLSLAVKHGAVVQEETKVLGISKGWKTPRGANAVLVSTNKGSVLADKCILACGAWTSKLIKSCLGIELPVRPLHTNIAYWQVEDEFKQEFLAENGFPTFAYYDAKYFYGTPSLEYPGLIKASIHGGRPCDADDRVFSPDVDELCRILSPWIEFAFRKKVKWIAPVMAEACMYSMTPDQDFILDVVPNSEGRVLVAAGFSGHGFKVGPLVGKIMADLAVNGGVEGVSMDWFKISRFDKCSYGNQKSFDAVQELSKLDLRNQL